MKVCEKCGEEIATKDGENRCQVCEEASASAVKRKHRNAIARANRQARDEAMRSLGLTKAKGAMGGVYWE